MPARGNASAAQIGKRSKSQSLQVPLYQQDRYSISLGGRNDTAPQSLIISKIDIQPMKIKRKLLKRWRPSLSSLLRLDGLRQPPDYLLQQPAEALAGQIRRGGHFLMGQFARR